MWKRVKVEHETLLSEQVLPQGAELRIHLILMRIWILNLHWKNIDLDSVYFFKIYWIFFIKAEFPLVLFFSLVIMRKLDKPFKIRKILKLFIQNFRYAFWE